MPSPIHQAIKAIAVKVHALASKIGQTQNLQTDDKTLVGAINEVKAASSTVDNNAVNALIDNKLNNITGGASSAFDTLKEIEDAIGNSGAATAEILRTLGEIKNSLKALEDYVGINEDILTSVQNALNTGA